MTDSAAETSTTSPPPARALVHTPHSPRDAIVVTPTHRADAPARALVQAPAPPLPIDTITLDPDDGLWTRLRGESMRDYARFEAYRRLPVVDRTPRKAREAYIRQHPAANPGSTTTWSSLASRYQWRARAEAYDEHMLHVERAAEEVERKQARNERILAMKGLHAKAISALMQLNPSDFSAKDTINALKVATEQLRIEYGGSAKSVNEDEDAMPSIKVLVGVSMDAL